MTSYSRPSPRTWDVRLYPKLAPRARSIRLIALIPGFWSDKIVCFLRETALSSKIQFKALSYAWRNNDSSEDVPIIINQQAVVVSSNLFAALRRLRQPETIVDVWVDSLCINQLDVAERTQQVNMMREIYETSQEVVIWLGEKSVNDDLGDSCLAAIAGQRAVRPDEDDLARIEWYGDDQDLPKLNAYISSVAKRDASFNTSIRDIFGGFCVLYLLSRQVPASEIKHLRHIDYSMPIVKGLYAIMDQSWWTRTWVVQETVVAKKATIYYSKLSAPWSMFSRAALEYDRTHLLGNVNSVYPYLHDGQPLMHFARMVMEIESTRMLWLRIQPTSLLPLLRKFRARNATDQRDKVFALLGLVRHWGRAEKIIPDYSQGARQVFWETTTKLIEGTGSLSVLAGTLQQHSTQWELHPSWVTDWSCPPEVHENVRVGNLTLYNASMDLSGAIKVHSRSILETTACSVDSIVFVGQELPIGTGGQASRLRLVVSEWEKSLARFESSTYIGGGSVEDAFWRLLCGDAEYCKEVGEGVEEEKIEFRRAKPSGSTVYRRWRWVDPGANRRTSIIGGYWQEAGGGDGTKDENAFQHALECASGFRRLFITGKGYIGTGPGNVREGDQVFILYGSRVPFILRKASRTITCDSEPLDVLVSQESKEPTYIPIHLARAMDVAGEPKKPVKEVCNESHNDCHFVVGDCYVHGIMDGEVRRRPDRFDAAEPRKVFLV